MDTINETLNELRIEDFIWIIYLFLILFALASNHFEKQFVLTRNQTSENNFRKINTFIFFVTLLIYLYFVRLNWKNLKKLDASSSPKSVLFANLSFFVAILFLIGGVISLILSLVARGEEDFILNFF